MVRQIDHEARKITIVNRRNPDFIGRPTSTTFRVADHIDLNDIEPLSEVMFFAQTDSSGTDVVTGIHPMLVGFGW